MSLLCSHRQCGSFFPAPLSKAFIGMLAVLGFLCVIAKAGSVADEIRPGELVDAVHCQRAPGQSYALYLPTAYTPQKKWPIVYAFDPGADGARPVRLYKEVAEKYGYILAGSNNSQNFLADEVGKAVQAMLSDTEERFALDPRRIYTTGFSGGARVATMVALRCSDVCKIAGVVASGGTYPANINPSEKDSFLYFMGLGDTDFNYPEVVRMRLTKERLGSPYRVRMFPGPHQWSPAGIFEDAIQWFQLRAMQAGTISKDDAFITREREKLLAEAQQAEQVHDSLRQFFAYKSLVEDFQGLADTSDAERRFQLLKSSPELKKDLARERDEAETQQRLQGEAANNIDRFSADPTRFDPDLRDAIVSSLARLKQTGEKARDERERQIYGRAFNGLFAQMAEAGQQRILNRKFNEALALFTLLAQAAPERAWPPLGIAAARAGMGDHARALKAVRQAVDTGRVSAEVLEKDRDLAPLFSDPEFQKIMEDLRKHPTTHQ
jgi:dienelactone hydrolase